MEAFGLAAGVLQVAGFGAEVGSTLWRCAKKLHNASKELEVIAGQVETTALSLRRVDALLKDPATKALHTPKLYEDTNTVSQGCHEVFHELDKSVKAYEAKSASGKMRLLSRTKWLFDSGRLAELGQVLRRYNDVLHLMVSVMTIVEGRRAATKDELQALEANLKVLALSNKDLTDTNKTLTETIAVIARTPNSPLISPGMPATPSAQDLGTPTIQQSIMFNTFASVPLRNIAAEPAPFDPTSDHLQRCMDSVQELAKSISQAMANWHGRSLLDCSAIHRSYERVSANLEQLPADLECMRCMRRTYKSNLHSSPSRGSLPSTCTCDLSLAPAKRRRTPPKLALMDRIKPHSVELPTKINRSKASSRSSDRSDHGMIYEHELDYLELGKPIETKNPSTSSISHTDMSELLKEALIEVDSGTTGLEDNAVQLSGPSSPEPTSNPTSPAEDYTLAPLSPLNTKKSRARISPRGREHSASRSLNPSFTYAEDPSAPGTEVWPPSTRQHTYQSDPGAHADTVQMNPVVELEGQEDHRYQSGPDEEWFRDSSHELNCWGGFNSTPSDGLLADMNIRVKSSQPPEPWATVPLQSITCDIPHAFPIQHRPLVDVTPDRSKDHKGNFIDPKANTENAGDMPSEDDQPSPHAKHASQLTSRCRPQAYSQMVSPAHKSIPPPPPPRPLTDNQPLVSATYIPGGESFGPGVGISSMVQSEKTSYMSHKAVPPSVMPQNENKEAKARLDEAMRKLLTEAGFAQSQIDDIMDKQKVNNHQNPNRQTNKVPVYAKIHTEYVSTETLRYYDIPWEYDRNDPSYIIILREMDKHEINILLDHTKALRNGRLLLDAQKKEKPEYAFYRKRDRNGSRVQDGHSEWKTFGITEYRNSSSVVNEDDTGNDDDAGDSDDVTESVSAVQALFSRWLDSSTSALLLKDD